MNAIVQPAHVNEKYHLFIDTDSRPTIRNLDGSLTRIPDNRFGRWWVRTHYQSVSATQEARAWYAQCNPEHVGSIPYLCTPPMQHQHLSLYRMLISNCALWLDMGVGKTFICLMHMLYCFNRLQDRAALFLVVSPVSVFVTWEDEVKKHVARNAHMRVLLAHGAHKKKTLNQLRLAPPSRPSLLITSYATLPNIVDDIKRLPIFSMYLDESSQIKNLEANRTKAALRVAYGIPNLKRYCLSGTPSTSSPEGFYTQYELLGRGFSGSPDLLTHTKMYVKSLRFCRAQLPDGKVVNCQAWPREGENENAWMDRWLNANGPDGTNQTYKQMGFYFGWRATTPRVIRMLNFYHKPIDTQNLDRLNRITQLHAYTLKKEDVVKDLPEKTFTVRSVEMAPEQREAYNRFVKENIAVLDNKQIRFNDRQSPHAKLVQIANGYIVDDQKKVHYFQNNPKLADLLVIIEESGDQRGVIWSPWRPQIAQVVAFLKKNHIDCRQIHGDVTPDERRTIMHEFQKPDGPRWLVANPEVAGIGLNMTWGTLAIILASWYRPDTRLQLVDRMHRIGQKNAVTVMDLIAKNTLESKILSDLKQDIDTEKTIIRMNDLTGAN